MELDRPVLFAALRADVASHRTPAWIVLTAAFLVTPMAAAQSLRSPIPAIAPAEAGNEQLVTPELIEARRQQADSSLDLDEATKRQIADLYQQSLDALYRSAESAAKAQSLRQQIDSVQARQRHMQQRLEELRASPTAPPSGLTLPELEQELGKLERSLAERKQEQIRAEAEPSSRASRRKEVRNLLFSIPKQLQDIDRQLELPAPRDEPPLATLARRTELAARRMAVEQTVPCLENELAKYDAEDALDLVRIQRDLSIQEVAVIERTLQSLDGRVKQLREDAAREAVRQAEEEVFQTSPLLKDLATRNKELAAEAQRLTQRTSQTDEQLRLVNAELEKTRRLFGQATARVETVGLTRTVGAQLRKQRASLPDVSSRHANIRNRQQDIEELRFELFELDDERTELAKPELIVQQMLAEVPAGMTAGELSRLKEAAGRILDRKREYLDALIRNENAYFDALTTLDTAEQELINLTEDFVSYIDERVLWIRSGKPLSAELAFNGAELSAFSPAQWPAVASRLWSDFRRDPNRSVAALAVFLVLFSLRRRLQRKTAEIGELAERRNCTRFSLTLQATVYTLVLSATWPAVTWYVAWCLSRSPDGDGHVSALGAGLSVMAGAFFPVELLRQICRPRGLAESHFDWPRSAVLTLRKNLLGAMVVGMPLVLVTSVLHALDPEHGSDSLERVLFLSGCVGVSLFLGRILRPSGGVLHEYIAFHRDGWLDRLKYVWYWLGIASPLTLGALAFSGFYYTALQLTERLFLSLFLIIVLIAVRSFLLRLLLVHRRQLSIRQARERRAAAMAALSGEGAGGAPSRTIVPVEETVDLAQLSTQTQRILTTGILVAVFAGVWCIWDDVIPALRVLDSKTIWTTVVPVTESTQEVGRDPQVITRTIIQTVTIADLLLAVLVGVITLIAFRNIPGLLEIAVLQRLPLDASVRYAVTTLASYAIIMLGTVVACSTLGLRWSQIQWLATALTFGLAFGLQEMFANFVAGLIILFERPIRVGDVVTVDDVTGVVSRVRIRATTITNWDRKEFVVPNKEFITGRLLNWTLSDKINRIVINVGVAYGSDSEKVRELLLKVAKDHPLLLDNPEPFATFDGFGDSALNFTLRAFLPTLENRPAVVHDLHTAIYKAFAEAGIGIPFPQRELHIRMLEPLTVASSNASSNGKQAHQRIADYAI